MRDTVMPAIKLLVITLFAALLLSGVNYITKGPIAQHSLDKQNEARKGALSAAQEFEEIDFSSLSGADKHINVKAVHKGTADGTLVGYTVIAIGKGYGGDIEVTVGIKANGTVEAVLINSHGETKDIGTKCMENSWLVQFVGKNGQTALGKDVNAVSGATRTSEGITGAVNNAMAFYTEFLAGGDAQ